MKTNFTKRLLSVVVLMAMLITCFPAGVITASATGPENSTPITADSTASISISTAYDAQYFEFVPTVSGRYSFYSSANSGDTRGALLDADGYELVSDDDSAGNGNFIFYYECLANTTYYVKAYMFGSNTGRYTLNVVTLELYCSHEYVVTSNIPVTCTSNGQTTYSCSLCDDSYTETTRFLGHDFADGFCTVCGTTEAAVDIWDGTVDTSWYDSSELDFVITTAEQLAGLAALVNGGNNFYGKTIYLASNIDLAGINWAPIGSTINYPFSGAFDGQCHVIYNLTIQKTTNDAVLGIGFFGAIKEGMIKNLGIENASVTVSGGRSGIMCGVAASNSLIENCYTIGSITIEGSGGCGGGVGIGGFVGDMRGGSIIIRNCYSSGEVTAPSSYTDPFVGGFVGFVCGTGDEYGASKYIENCYSVNTVVTSAAKRGGFVGGLFAGALYIDNSFDMSTVNGSYSKALIGHRDSQYSPAYYINNTYYHESGSSSFGGTATSVNNFKSEDWLTSTLGWDFASTWGFQDNFDYPILQSFLSGGYTPHVHEYVETSRTDATCTVEGSAIYTCTGCEAFTTEKIPATGHDFADGFCTRCGESAPEVELWDGTVDTSWYNDSDYEFIINTAEELAGLAYLVNAGNNFYGKTIYLGCNLDLNGIEWTPIGTGTGYGNQNVVAFSGQFDGAFHTIYGLTITSTDNAHIGLFGSVDSATIVNLAIENAYISVEQTTNYGTSGGILAGYVNASTIDQIAVSGDVTFSISNSSILCAALAIGYVANGGATTITNVAARGTVYGYCGNSNSYVGGIVGVKDYSEGRLIVENCLFVGSITASDRSSHSYAGGIVGISCGGESINNCVFIGDILSDNTRDAIVDSFSSTIYNNCYYNADFTSTRGTLTEISSFNSQDWITFYLGWNLETVWGFSNTIDYPILQGFVEGGYTPHVHEYVEESRVEATCTTEGAINYVCTECGRTYSETICALGHDFVLQSTTEATCSTDGVNVYACSRCDETYEETHTYAYGHSYENGYCVSCGGHIFPDFIVIEPDYNSYVEITESYGYVIFRFTPTYSGRYQFYSSNNNGDTYGTLYNANGDFITSNDDSAGNGNFSIIYDCEAGTTYFIKAHMYSSRTGSYTFNVATIEIYCDHEYVVESTTTADCTNDGITTYVCSLCGNTYSETTEWAYGHEITLQNTTEADCENNGVYVYGCTRCDYTYEEIHAYAYGHSYENAYCVTCGKHIFADAIVIGTDESVYIDTPEYVYFQFTPTQSGQYRFYSSEYNGDPRAWLLDANGIELYYDDDAGDSWNFSIYYDCEANTTYYIKAYNYSGYYTFNTATIQLYCDHEYEETSRTDATCTSEGTIYYVCTKCDTTNSETIPMLEHDYTLESSASPDCTNSGYETYVCAACGCTYTDTIPALRHDYVDGACTRCGAEEPDIDVWDGTIDTSWYNDYESEFILYTAKELAGLAQLVNAGNSFSGKTIYLGADIDLAGLEWMPIGADVLMTYFSGYVPEDTFSGTFDGCFHTIFNLTVNELWTSFTGLFGTTYNATIKNVELVGVDIDCNGGQYRSKAGSLIGYARETLIQNCGVFNAVVSSEATSNPASAGGFIGLIYGSTIENCFAYADVSGNGHIGGLVGADYSGSYTSTIRNCYVIGSITSTNRSNTNVTKCMAGILAYGKATISNCVYMGQINNPHSFGQSAMAYDCTVSNCYYDITDYVSNFSPADFMSQEWIAYNLAWDFDTVWGFTGEYDYPVLQGFIEGGYVPHDHQYEETSRTDATCTTDGVITYTCTECGRTINETIPALDHDYVLQSSTEADCENNGSATYACSRCDETYTNIFQTAFGHSYENNYCVTCGKHIFADAIIVGADESLYISTPGYVYFAFTPVASGRYQFYSTNYSGDPSATLLDANGNELYFDHDGGSDWNFSIYYDCVANQTYYLRAHNYTGYYTFNIATIEIYCNHEYIVDSTTEATCTTDGVITYVCTLCGEVYYEIVEYAFGHDYIFQSSTEADCENNGVNVYACSRCGETYEEIHTSAYGHNYENGYCVNCGEFIFAGAIVIAPGESAYVEIIEAYGSVYFQFTPTQSGRYQFYSTNNNGDTYVSLYDANGNYLISDDDGGNGNNFNLYYDCEAGTTYYIQAHMWSSRTGSYTLNVSTVEIYCSHEYTVESTTSADCENDGITTYVCSLCGNTYTEVVEYALGHDYVLQSTTEADCVNNGVNVYACSRCGDGYEEIHTNAYGHNYENGYCITCGEHIFADFIVIEPDYNSYVEITESYGFVIFRFTPTQSGRYQFYSSNNNGDTYGTLYDANGDYLTSNDDSAGNGNFSIYYDCEAGTTYYIKAHMYSSNTGYYTFNTVTVEIYCDHAYTVESTTAADCENDGIATYVCSLCGNTYTEVVESALGHDYVLQSSTPADCVNSGIEAYTCSRCGDSYEIIIRPVGHNYENGICIYCGAEGSGNILVIMDNEPWNYTSITNVLNSLVNANKIEYWDSVSTSAVTAETLRGYGVVYIANDQNTSAQSRIKAMKGMLEDYVSNGGILIFGFVTMSTTGEYGNTLPGGVSTHYNTAPNNYIVDSTHPIISGILSDNYTLTDSHMFGNSASHDYIDASTLPEGSKIILTDSYSRPTLAEYSIGTGTVIATGLTWEYYYHNTNGNFAQYAFDDLFLYAISIANGWTSPDPDNTHTPSDWIVDTEATCSTAGSRHIECIECGAILTIEEIPTTGHTYGEWIINVEATCIAAGSKRAYCTECDNAYVESYIPATGHAYNSELVRSATCTTPGIMAYTCTKCADRYEVYIYSEHQYVHSERIEPTCTEDGADVYVCTRCEDSYTVVIAGGHDYIAEIITVATPTTAGEMRYTCSKCGDYYTEEIPARPHAEILLVQDRLPWSENSNASLLDAMMATGYIGGWDLTTTAGFGSVDLSRFNVILIANDQTTATYEQLRVLQDALVEFARAGGVVIYGACDNGWAGGNISYTLPEGVEKNNYYSHHNYIVDASHPIVLGSMTDGKPLTNDLLYGNYCSHTAFNMNTLPADANIILQDGQGNPTLVEYAVGEGHVILSGLTWEFYYTREAYDYRLNTTYTRNVYDDLIVYAASLSSGCDHAWDDGVVVEPTCTTRGYTLHVCTLCERTMKENYTEALGHALGEWEIETPATEEAEGYKVKRCLQCGEILIREVLPIINAATITVVSPSDTVIWGDEITFTVVIDGADPVKSMALTPIFDTDYFELVSVSWVIQAFVSDIEDGTLRSVAAWRSPVDINTTVYTITLRAKALTDSTTIDFTAILGDEVEGIIVASVVGKTVSIVECPHTEGTYVHMNEGSHAYICDHCGYTEMQAHVYDDEYDTDCNICGHAKYLLGDVDGDGDVDSDDSVYLLYHIFFEESDEYPINQVCDFNGDGLTDSDDALYLLYHVLYEYTGDYPLHDAG